jgi:hypothetical protein
MEYLLVGGISFGLDHWVAMYTFGPLYEATHGIQESLPAAINGSLMGISAYLIAEAVMGNKLNSLAFLGIIGGVSTLQILGGKYLYWNIKPQYPMLTDILFNSFTAIGTVSGVALANYIR